MESKFDKLYNQIITEQREIIEEGWLGKAATAAAIGAAAFGASRLAGNTHNDKAVEKETPKMQQTVQKDNSSKQKAPGGVILISEQGYKSLIQEFKAGELTGMEDLSKYADAKEGWWRFCQDLQNAPEYQKLKQRQSNKSYNQISKSSIQHDLKMIKLILLNEIGMRQDDVFLQKTPEAKHWFQTAIGIEWK